MVGDVQIGKGKEEILLHRKVVDLGGPPVMPQVGTVREQDCPFEVGVRTRPANIRLGDSYL